VSSLPGSKRERSKPSVTQMEDQIRHSKQDNVVGVHNERWAAFLSSSLEMKGRLRRRRQSNLLALTSSVITKLFAPSTSKPEI
jgi:hypothetical protein